MSSETRSGAFFGHKFRARTFGFSLTLCAKFIGGLRGGFEEIYQEGEEGCLDANKYCFVKKRFKTSTESGPNVGWI